MEILKLRFVKRTIIACLLMLPYSFVMSAQEITAWTVSYDNNFNAVVKVKVNNTSKKTITAIKFYVWSRSKYASSNNFLSDKSEVKSFTRTISPNGSFTFEIPVRRYEDYVVKGVIIDEVRYSDGTLRY